MIKHVILWKLKEMPEDKKTTVKANAKAALEGLLGVVPGLTKITVNIDGLDSSNADMMLDSEFESAEALANYQKHPAHVEVANTYVRPFTETRLCLDYED